MKRIILFITLFSAVKSYSQQDPHYTMYMFNMMCINPAYAGALDVTDITLLGRKQWLGFDGAPQTVSFNLHHPFYYDKMGVGISFINDRIGVMEYNHVNLAYAYKVKFKTSALSIGIQPSFSQISSGANQLKLDAPTSGAVYDNAFNNINQIELKAGGGLFWQSKKSYLGISTPHLTNFALSSSSLYESKKHFFLTAGHVIDLKGDYKLKPSVLVKYTNGAPVSLDLNCNFYFNQNFGIGLSYRNFDSMDAIIEYRMKNNIKIGYAYDYTLTRLRNYNTGSHELLLNWQFGHKKGKIITPRYF